MKIATVASKKTKLFLILNHKNKFKIIESKNQKKFLLA
jgi:hypothetical protein